MKKKKIQIVLRNSLDPEPDPELDPELDPDSDFWLDPESMNMDPKHWMAGVNIFCETEPFLVGFGFLKHKEKQN